MVLATSEYGDGRPLVVLHGLFGSRDNWHTVAGMLADLRKVLAMDLPNHGESPHAIAFDYDSMAEAVRETLDGREIDSVDLLGHSMGGKAAMRFCQNHPDRVGRAVIADIAPVDYPQHSHAEIIAGMRAVELSEVDSRGDADDQMAPHISSKAIRSFILKNLVREDTGYSWRLNIDAIESNYRAIRGYPESGEAFEGPCLFLAGELSTYLGAEERQAIQSLFPNAEVRTIDGTGHWLHAEKQDEFVAQVRSFLQH